MNELVGKRPSRPRPGRPRAKVASRRDRIPPDCFPPFWRKALPEMRGAYSNMCAYLALYIEYATGSPSVDHVVPKSRNWKVVYEWSNYRLESALINSKKNNLELALDPFEMDAGLFELELVEFQVKPAAKQRGAALKAVVDTIEVLGLNQNDCIRARKEYVSNYRLGPGNEGIDLSYLQRRAPFVAQELRRQGLLVRGDT